MSSERGALSVRIHQVDPSPFGRHCAYLPYCCNATVIPRIRDQEGKLAYISGVCCKVLYLMYSTVKWFRITFSISPPKLLQTLFIADHDTCPEIVIAAVRILPPFDLCSLDEPFESQSLVKRKVPRFGKNNAFFMFSFENFARKGDRGKRQITSA